MDKDKEIEGLKMKIDYLESIIDDCRDTLETKCKEVNRVHGMYKMMKRRFKIVEAYNLRLREILREEGLIYKINENVQNKRSL